MIRSASPGFSKTVGNVSILAPVNLNNASIQRHAQRIHHFGFAFLHPLPLFSSSSSLPLMLFCFKTERTRKRKRRTISPTQHALSQARLSQPQRVGSRWARILPLCVMWPLRLRQSRFGRETFICLVTDHCGHPTLTAFPKTTTLNPSKSKTCNQLPHFVASATDLDQWSSPYPGQT